MLEAKEQYAVDQYYGVPHLFVASAFCDRLSSTDAFLLMGLW